jgi:heme A synthase
MSLPAQSISPHYNIAWAGFDTLLAGLVLTTAWLAYRRSPYVASTSAATSALLLADAWFDITTAAPGRPLLAAVLLAAFVELPAAVLAFHLHRTASKRRSS